MTAAFDPLVVEVTRGGSVESYHHVSAAVVDVGGSVISSWGDSDGAVLPRSAIKPIQARPLIDSGAADAAGLSDVELALACASHAGEPAHVEAVDAWLDRLALDHQVLECGKHSPLHGPSAHALSRDGQAVRSTHNNCSGKHTGFVTVCQHLGLDTTGYIGPAHPLQRQHVTPAIEQACDFGTGDQEPGIDGCGIPVWSLPLDRLALGWARLSADPTGRRLVAAMVAHPYFVAGTDRSDTVLIEAAGGSVAARTGAEGVVCAVVIESGIGVSVKAHDGARRAADVAIEWVLRSVGVELPEKPIVISNWVGTNVGEIRVAPNPTAKQN